MADYDEANYFEATDGSIRPRVGKGDPDGFERMVQRMIDGNVAPIKFVETGEAKKEPGTKFDAGKPRYDLIPPEALEALAYLYGTGAVKYGERNWEKGMTWGRVFRAMCSHGWKWFMGEEYDPIDKQHHLIAVAWNAFALYTYQKRNLGKDDRPNVKQ